MVRTVLNSQNNQILIWEIMTYWYDTLCRTKERWIEKMAGMLLLFNTMKHMLIGWFLSGGIIKKRHNLSRYALSERQYLLLTKMI